MYKKFRTFHYTGDAFHAVPQELIVESLLEIVVNGRRYSTIMFTPHMNRELVVGFLFTEGLIRYPREICGYRATVTRSGGTEDLVRAEVTLAGNSWAALDGLEGRRISYSSCGICGTESHEQLRRGLTRVKSRQRFSMAVITGLDATLQGLQPLYKRTGGAHAALLLDAGGRVLARAEDMGRHNALDKVIGRALMEGIACGDKILLSSGRASLEMILKTARAGCPLFVVMSRPTSQAVEAAKFYNITLVDLAKDANRIYTHGRRIEGF